ncbi:hypothetical protein C0Q70_19006 [Pomacea canaliculata]|uniref:C2H2-type domain-containing protein n=2 Tax=Pomacea canaliculata TaxID=400727 RepID=A0A2T7NI63_POMCA|nr:zinc finger protein ZFAT-like isoform X3 [Pomacea canaliculata]XP_025076372.1 zinc finger protein ZFAT-like isoform X3 [Pomacea canaliculata]PVD20845.1 hypothetical protein C0Q70_19006 [Pomacea canaliculata]
MDTFICGTCQGAFNDIEIFMQHKQAGCTRPQQEIIRVHVDGSGEVTEVTGTQSVIEDDDHASVATLAYLNEISAKGHLAAVEGEDGDLPTRTFIILNNAHDIGISSSATITADAVQLEALGAVGSTIAATTTGQECTESVSSTAGVTEIAPKKSGRRCGRPRKGEEKNKPVQAVPATCAKPEVPEQGSDGKLRCGQCQRAFNKERHYKTHKCLASSAYVDISKRDIFKIDSGDEDEEEEAGARDDDQEEYKAVVDLITDDEDDDTDNDDESRKRASGGTFKKYQLHTDPDVDVAPREKSTETIEDVPIFRNEEEKLEFEASVTVDLSCVDHMFKIHVIDQDVNEHGGGQGRSVSSSLSLYSCTVCEKVFKTLSHMRLHCLVHTDLRPFRCSKCQYSTNSKGNLYTHMRKHTGQFYRCKHCDFRTVNKSHLLEHEATHSKTRHPCALCHKDYSTGKSLINHVRKYHANSRRGRQYLQTFLQGRQARGSTVIHQCHVCNRKFKKKIDRDRHLFVHDIRDVGTTQQCELCDYSASRRVYLEKHYLKHRVLYCCAACPMKFLSTIRLLDHLENNHSTPGSDGCVAASCEELFERSINNSLYLPEPDEKLPAVDKQYINLPPELSSTTLCTDPNPSEMPCTTLTSQSTNVSSSLDVSDSFNTAMTRGAITPLQVVDTERRPELENRCNSGSDCFDGSVVVTGTEPTPEAALASDGEKSPLCNASLISQTVEDRNKALVSSSTSLTIVGSVDSDAMLSTGVSQSDDIGDKIVLGTSTVITPEYAQDIETTFSSDASLISKSDGNSKAMLLSSSDLSTQTSAEQGMLTADVITDASMADNPNPGDIKSFDTLQVSFPSSAEEARVCMDTSSVTEEAGVCVDTNSVTADSESVLVPLAPNPGLALGPDVDEDEMADGIENEESSMDTSSHMEELKESQETNSGRVIDVDSEGKVSVVERLGYWRMNMQILHKMRETFGSEECEFCGRLFHTKQDYEPHLRTHTGDKPFRCEQCGLCTITKECLRRHVERDHENIQFPCKSCNFVATSRGRLWSHQLTHLGVSGLECPQCQERFETMKRLRAHIICTHPEMPREDMEKLTGYKHKTQGKLGRRSYKCPYCDRIFIRANSELQKHIWIHEGIKPFKCSECSYACRSKNNLQAHMLRHSNQKPFSCQECGKAYKSKTALRWHVRSHKDGKLFKCDKCSYEAQQRSHLKRHMETHEVVKRFVCQHCDYSANTAGYLKIHYTRVHKGMVYLPELQPPSPADGSTTSTSTEARVFKCLSCDYVFGNLSDLKRHLKIRHHVQVQDIAGIEQMQISEVEVLQCSEEASVGTGEVMEPGTMLSPAFSQTVTSSELDEKTASAVTLLQQIITMQQQGAFGQQEIKVLSEDGQMVAVNPETIIVQQHGEQVLVTNGDDGEEAGQYVIQYVSPSDDPTADPSMEGVPMEIQTVDEADSVAVLQG